MYLLTSSPSSSCENLSISRITGNITLNSSDVGYTHCVDFENIDHEVTKMKAREKNLVYKKVVLMPVMLSSFRFCLLVILNDVSQISDSKCGSSGKVEKLKLFLLDSVSVPSERDDDHKQKILLTSLREKVKYLFSCHGNVIECSEVTQVEGEVGSIKICQVNTWLLSHRITYFLTISSALFHSPETT